MTKLDFAKLVISRGHCASTPLNPMPCDDCPGFELDDAPCELPTNDDKMRWFKDYVETHGDRVPVGR